MHFRIQTDEINYGLGMVTRALSPRPIKQAYEGVLIETDDQGLVLTCTDGEMSIRARVNAEVEEDGCVLLPARLFADMMRRQPVGEVDVRIEDDRKRARIRADGTNSSMACMVADDFPDIRDLSADNRVILPCQRFRDAVSRVQFAVSTDENRKILTGILMEVYATETCLVALDGFRLSLQRIEAENTWEAQPGKDHLRCVTPGRILNEIGKMTPEDGEITIVFNSGHVMYSFGSVRVYATLLAGEFIAYQTILPKEWTTEAIVSRAALSDAIDRCGLMAREGKNNLIHVHLETAGRILLTANAERGDVREELAEEVIGNDLDIAFNARYLSDIIRNVDTEKFRMCFNSSVSPCMMQPLKGNAFTFLVLPVRLYNS